MDTCDCKTAFMKGAELNTDAINLKVISGAGYAIINTLGILLAAIRAGALTVAVR